MKLRGRNTAVTSAFVFLAFLIVLAACQGRQTHPPANTPVSAMPAVSEATASTPEPRPPTGMPEPTPSATPTSSPTSTPTPIPETLHDEQLMLHLINKERRHVGVARVKLGSNHAAQVHADNALANCHGGHWSIDGLKPYMRYSLAGGYQVNAENVSSGSYCFDEEGFQSLNAALKRSMVGLMDSEGHREKILDPKYQAVSLGISCDDDFKCAVVQIFEGAYIEYRSLPLIKDGILSLSASAVGGNEFTSGDDLIVVLHWDPPPRALTRGQLVRTSSYDSGVPIVGIVRSKEGGNIQPRPLKYMPPL